jgi:hypothetical protein
VHKQEIPKFVFQIAHKSEAILDEVSLLSLEEGQVRWYRYPIDKSTTLKRRTVSYTGLEAIPVVKKNAIKTTYRFKSQDVMRWAFQPINCVPVSVEKTEPWLDQSQKKDLWVGPSLKMD